MHKHMSTGQIAPVRTTINNIDRAMAALDASIANDKQASRRNASGTNSGGTSEKGPEDTNALSGLLNKASSLLRRVSGRAVLPFGSLHDAGNGGGGNSSGGGGGSKPTTELNQKRDSSKGQSAASTKDLDMERLRTLEVRYAQLKGMVGRCVGNVKAPVVKMDAELDDLRKLLDVLSTHAKLSRPSPSLQRGAEAKGKGTARERARRGGE